MRQKNLLRGGGIRSRLIAAVAAGSLVVVGVTASVAQASVNENVVADHMVSTVQPEGTEINLFDYWITSEYGQDDTTKMNDWVDEGINAGHTLKFGNDMRNHVPTGWCIANPDVTVKPADGTDGECAGNNDSRKRLALANAGGKAVRQGIVQSKLDGDYPVLSGGSIVEQSTESLKYLFDSSGSDYKRAYTNVDGLLRYVNGYYTYNAKENYAAFDEANNTLRVYDAPAITNASRDNQKDRLGQFFPFDPASDVFDNVHGGTLYYQYGSEHDLYSNDESLNHFFGLTMTTQFTQPLNGKAADGTDVTYNFSGDDDVWVFIDGLLVGDVGGIHSATSLEINFQTGAVYVYTDKNGNNKYDEGIDSLVGEQNRTIRSLMKTADGNLNESVFRGDTLADYSTHTLQFFYLERGHTDSNMSLSFNLQETPASTIHKTDQNGNPLSSGVTFDLYIKDEYGNSGNQPWFTGTTGGNGDLVITTPTGAYATLDQLAAIDDQWVLVENAVAGYRSKTPIQLTIDSNNILAVSNENETAATVRPKAQITALSEEIGGITITSGTTFAVVVDKDGNSMTYMNGEWVAGESIIEAAKSYSGYVMNGFHINMDEMPGVMGDYVGNDPRYRINYYHIEGSLQEASDKDIVPIEDDSAFSVKRAATIEVSNIQDTLTIHKTDAGNSSPLAGATFTLYKGNDDGSDEVAIYTTDDNGNASISMDVLTAGDYVLKETAWPTGYENTSISINLHVDDSGVVYVDAGAENDNVSVSTTLGSLAWSLHNQAVDNGPLAAVSAGMQIGEYADGSMTWESSGNVEDLTFDAETGVYHTNADTAFSITADAGWSRIHVNHDADVLDSVIGVNTVINVSNTVKTLSVDQKLIKYIQGRDWQTDDQFTFRLDGYEAVESGESWSLIKESVVPTPVGATAVAGETSVWDLVLDYDAQSCTAGTEGDLSSCEKQIKFSIPYNKTEDGKIYVFIVSEVEPNDPEPGMVYSKDRWLVSMAVSGSSGLQTDLPVKVPEDWQPGQSLPSTFDLDGPIEFTNRFIEVSALPLTGGDTTARNIMLAGGGVLLLAGAAWLLARRRRV